MNKYKKFVFISLVIFGIITLVSFTFFKTCTSDYCDFSYSTTLNIIITSLGIIGLVYCLFVLKEFNVVVDKKLMSDYSDVLDDLDSKQENSDNKKKDKVLSF